MLFTCFLSVLPLNIEFDEKYFIKLHKTKNLFYVEQVFTSFNFKKSISY
ncbi:hypothetical protein EMIT036CA2_20221 [Chryseobacterium sp. IT-36CA2]